MNPYFEIIGRSGVVYIFMLLAIRINGKKELSQLNPADVVLILLISNSVQNAMVGSNSSLWGGLLAASVLFALNFVLKKWLSKSLALKKALQDVPETLIHNGIVDLEKLKKLDLTQEELEEAMREHGVAHYKDVRLATLEINGTISIISGGDSLKQTHHSKKKSHKKDTV